MTPGRVRSLGGGAKFLTKVRFDAEYLRHIHTHISLEPEIFPQAKLRLIGMRTRFFGIVSDKNNMGRKLPGLWQQFLPRMHEATDRIGDVGYGVIQQTPACTDELEYYAAVEIRRFGRTPRGMVALTVPAACYAQFAHRGLVQNLDHTVNYI